MWQTFNPTLAIFYAIGQNFIIINVQKMQHNLAIWSHWLQRRQGRKGGGGQKPERGLGIKVQKILFNCHLRLPQQQQ